MLIANDLPILEYQQKSVSWGRVKMSQSIRISVGYI